MNKLRWYKKWINGFLSMVTGLMCSQAYAGGSNKIEAMFSSFDAATKPYGEVITVIGFLIIGISFMALGFQWVVCCVKYLKK